ncbi:LytTR family transcriptional regulator DNA-binding domain-containing protein [Runella rosea]|nr:LytTR family transcriptional regulator DNA-binding domain-containing protein [Runella rosea]
MIVDNILISAPEVEYLTSASNYTYIYLMDGTRLLSSHNLGRITTHLALTRVHKRVSVNKTHISKVKEGAIVMKSGFVVAPSRRMKSVLLTLKLKKTPRSRKLQGDGVVKSKK